MKFKLLLNSFLLFTII